MKILADYFGPSYYKEFMDAVEAAFERKKKGSMVAIVKQDDGCIIYKAKDSVDASGVSWGSLIYPATESVIIAPYYREGYIFIANRTWVEAGMKRTVYIYMNHNAFRNRPSVLSSWNREGLDFGRRVEKQVEPVLMTLIFATDVLWERSFKGAGMHCTMLEPNSLHLEL